MMAGNTSVRRCCITGVPAELKERCVNDLRMIYEAELGIGFLDDGRTASVDIRPRFMYPEGLPS